MLAIVVILYKYRQQLLRLQKLYTKNELFGQLV